MKTFIILLIASAPVITTTIVWYNLYTFKKMKGAKVIPFSDEVNVKLFSDETAAEIEKLVIK